MDQVSISVVTDTKTIGEVCDLAAMDNVTCSKPTRVATGDASLRSPVGPQEARQLLEMVSLIFTTGAAALTFLDKLLELTRKLQKVTVDVRNAKTGRKIILLHKKTQKSELEAALKRYK